MYRWFVCLEALELELYVVAVVFSKLFLQKLLDSFGRSGILDPEADVPSKSVWNNSDSNDVLATWKGFPNQIENDIKN